MGATPDEHHGFTVVNPPHVSILRRIFNILGCIAAFPFYWFIVAKAPYAITLDAIVSILLAELNRFANERRRIKFYEQDICIRDKVDSEKGEKGEKGQRFGLRTLMTPRLPSTAISMSAPRLLTSSRLQIMAAVVGWREDPSLFTRALESYKYASGCRFLLVGIDGDEAQDEDMMNVFNHVYPDNSVVLHLTEPLGEVAERVREEAIAWQVDSGYPVDEAKCDMIALQHCIQRVKVLLGQHRISFAGSDGIRQLCLRQPHMHKKGIMFSSFIFSLVITDILGIEFLWSSDSDTLVMPDSLERTISAIAIDPTIGGASSGLMIHNANESIVAQLASAIYWGELYLTKSTPASTVTNDCQSGPCTAFRLAALPPILIPWYRQAIFGKRMVYHTP
jgi:hyaluronan synthase